MTDKNNTLACGSCAHYDPIMSAKRKRPSARGWCTKRSMYPALEAADQAFPPGVTRVAEGELAQPYIVRLAQVLPGCTLAQPMSGDAGAAKTRAVVAKNTDGGKKRLR